LAPGADGCAGVVEGVAGGVVPVVVAGGAVSNRLITSAVMSSAGSAQTIPESLWLKSTSSPRSDTIC
jgi:hypothetical protein